MNKKKLVGVVCAFACAVNLALSGTASADLRTVSEQADWAKHLKKVVFGENGPKPPSAIGQKTVVPNIAIIQRRICDVNGIELTSQEFSSREDYKRKVHPIIVVGGDYFDATNIGFGYIYYGEHHISEANNFRNQYDYMAFEKTIAHETTHSIEGHTHSKATSKEEYAEPKAEFGSVKLTANLPEGGWGIYSVALRDNNCYPEYAKRVLKSFEKECSGKVTINNSGSLVTYNAANNHWYNIVAVNRHSHDNAYFGCQVANCIAKGAFSLNNIQIMDNFLKQDIKFSGDYLLVCKDSRLPNGYRVLTELYGQKADLVRELENTKRSVLTDSPLTAYENKVGELLKPGKVTAWKMWLTCAVAADMDGRR